MPTMYDRFLSLLAISPCLCSGLKRSRCYWAGHGMVPYAQGNKHEKMLNRVAESIKPQVFMSNGRISLPLQLELNCSGFPIVITVALERWQL